MSTAIALHHPQVAGWESKLDLIKREIAKGASNDELEIFLHQCRKTGLDPLAKQIYFQKRGGKMTIITGIDGYRLVADRTGKYAGNDDPIFDDDKQPTKATVTVYKIVDGVRCAFTASARWSQYFPGDTLGFMWKKMPHLMLGKCAEALALRKAFPAELSGVYTAEEMEQADSGKSDVQRTAEAKLICADCDGEIDAYSYVDTHGEKKFATLEAVKEANQRDFPDVNLCGSCQVKRHVSKRKPMTLEQETSASVVAVTDKKQRVDVLAEEEKVDKALGILIDDEAGRAQGIINQVLPKKSNKPFMLRIESETNPAMIYTFGSFHTSHEEQLIGREGQKVTLWYDVTKKNSLTYRNIKEIESVDGKPVEKDDIPF